MSELYPGIDPEVYIGGVDTDRTLGNEQEASLPPEQRLKDIEEIYGPEAAEAFRRIVESLGLTSIEAFIKAEDVLDPFVAISLGKVAAENTPVTLIFLPTGKDELALAA